MIEAEGSQRAVRVAIVDDDPFVVQALRSYLSSSPQIEVLSTFTSARDLLAFLKRIPVDVLVSDVRMPGMNGIEATAAITAQCPGTKILILTTFDLDEYAFAGLRAGASGFLLKDTRPAELAEAIRTVAGGEAVVSPRITRRMLEMFASHLPEGGAGQAQEDPRIASLTPREREILILMAQGMSNAEIAADLVVSSTTVKTHVGNVLTKLNVRDRVQAVVVAYETGLMA